jgi:hypothetical protein
MPTNKAERLLDCCLEALMAADAEDDENAPSAVARVAEAAEGEPAWRQYFAVVAALDRALTLPPQQGATHSGMWKFGIGAVLDALERLSQETLAREGLS